MRNNKIYGNKHISLSYGELNQDKIISKYIHLNLSILSIMIELEPDYIMFSIGLFKTLRTNFTFILE
jgi:hypothetical protein